MKSLRKNVAVRRFSESCPACCIHPESWRCYRQQCQRSANLRDSHVVNRCHDGEGGVGSSRIRFAKAEIAIATCSATSIFDCRTFTMTARVVLEPRFCTCCNLKVPKCWCLEHLQHFHDWEKGLPSQQSVYKARAFKCDRQQIFVSLTKLYTSVVTCRISMMMERGALASRSCIYCKIAMYVMW